MDNNINNFLFTYSTKLINGGLLYKYLVTLAEKNSPEKVLSGEYSILVDVGEHV